MSVGRRSNGNAKPETQCFTSTLRIQKELLDEFYNNNIKPCHAHSDLLHFIKSSSEMCWIVVAKRSVFIQLLLLAGNREMQNRTREEGEYSRNNFERYRVISSPPLGRQMTLMCATVMAHLKIQNSSIQTRRICRACASLFE